MFIQLMKIKEITLNIIFYEIKKIEIFKLIKNKLKIFNKFIFIYFVFII